MWRLKADQERNERDVHHASDSEVWADRPAAGGRLARRPWNEAKLTIRFLCEVVHASCNFAVCARAKA